MTEGWQQRYQWMIDDAARRHDGPRSNGANGPDDDDLTTEEADEGAGYLTAEELRAFIDEHNSRFNKPESEA
jgi:hypothetical protein